MRFRLFVAWNIHTVVFLSIFVLLMLVLSVLFLVAVISLPPRFFYVIFSRCIYASTLSWMLAIPLSSSFLGTHNPLTSSLGCNNLCIIISFLFVWSICSSTLKMVPIILRRGQPRYLFLWWDICYVVWFRVVFSFSRDVLFYFFFILSPLIFYGARRPVFPSICKFPFLRAFWFFLNLVVLFLPSFVLFRFLLLA